ncbi:hypothetical protein JCM8202_006318 [Rhodotorula sphaerocarpa]
MLSAEEQAVLELLRAIPPLLPPDLTSSPPSSPPPAPTNGANPSRKTKRSHGVADPTGEAVVGLGIKIDAADESEENESANKRPRTRPPPTPAGTSARAAPPPPPPAAAANRTLFHDRVKITAAESTGVKQSPRLDGQRHERIEAEWPKDRLRALAAQCRAHGRKLKHAGDALSRGASSSPPSRKTTLFALAHHIDSVLLYVFSFWCDDTANKNCNVQQWASVYGLVSFVKKQALQEKIPVVLGLCYRVEAIAVYTTAMHEQKALHHKASQLLHASPVLGPSKTPRAPPPPPLPSGPPPPPPPPAGAGKGDRGSSVAPNGAAGSPVSLGASTGSSYTGSPAAPPPHQQPPPPPPAVPVPPVSSKGAEDALRAFVKASPELFRFQRLYDSSCSTLSPALMAEYYPRTWRLCTFPPEEGKAQRPSVAAFVVPDKPWSFAWPCELGRGTLGHQIAWGRALLEEWAEAEGIGYEVENVGVGVGSGGGGR